MPESLNVDPRDLHLSSDHLDMHEQDVAAAHGAIRASIEDSLSGWVGQSAAALQGVIAHLETVDSHITGELGRHNTLLRYMAYNYQTADDETTAAFIRTGQSL